MKTKKRKNTESKNNRQRILSLFIALIILISMVSVNMTAGADGLFSITLTAEAVAKAVQPPTDGSITIGSNYKNGGYTTWLQESLKKLGFNPGTIDGLWGTNTKNAVIAYQKSRGLTADGLAGKNTLTRLVSDIKALSNNATSSANRGQWLSNLIGTSAKEHGNGSGTQCVELPKWYAQQITGKVNKTAALGNGNTVAKGIANYHGWNYSTSKSDIKVGDIVSFNGTNSNGWDRTNGHVVIVYSVSGNTFKYIHQWKGSGTIHSGTATIGRSDIVGRARPPA